MIASLCPPAYASALSKKLHPASYAACMHSSASLSSSWVSNVTQLPNDSTLTLTAGATEPPVLHVRLHLRRSTSREGWFRTRRTYLALCRAVPSDVVPISPVAI